MEKPKTSLKGKILSFIPRAASTPVSFKSPPISPRKPAAASYSKPMPGGSVIPRDARRRLKNGSFDAREPSSPMVSCVGQVKRKKSKNKPVTATTMSTRIQPNALDRPPAEAKKKDAPMMILKLFKGKKLLGERTNHDQVSVMGKNEKTPSSLGHLKQFSSGRGVLANFDWKAHCGTSTAVAPDSCGDNDYYPGNNDDEKQPKTSIMPSSASDRTGSRIDNIGEEGIILEPKKEINLWKRRTTVPPPPLRL